MTTQQEDEAEEEATIRDEREDEARWEDAGGEKVDEDEAAAGNDDDGGVAEKGGAVPTFQEVPVGYSPMRGWCEGGEVVRRLRGPWRPQTPHEDASRPAADNTSTASLV
ncbi:hypothetical protein CDD83_5426 [Cordyceps sp. RAO-2017]|nr:hypothetical protein CDD83_5426 [Cordyceps sp. RAO-2017]